MTARVSWASAPARHAAAIFLCCDAGALAPAFFLARQIIDQDAGRDYDVVICATDRSVFPSDLPGGDVRFCEIDTGGSLDGLPFNEEITEATYLRLPAVDALGAAYDRLLYLDSDLYILRPELKTLLHAPMTCAVAAAPDLHAFARDDWRRHKKFDTYRSGLDLPDSHIYRNAGVLLIDVPKARADDSFGRVLRYAKANPDKLVRHDQSALNAALQDEIGLLSMRWNLPVVDGLYDESRAEDAVILHFVGQPKPWNAAPGTLRARFRDSYTAFFAQYPYLGIDPEDRPPPARPPSAKPPVYRRLLAWLANPLARYRQRQDWKNRRRFFVFPVDEARLRSIDARPKLV